MDRDVGRARYRVSSAREAASAEAEPEAEPVAAVPASRKTSHDDGRGVTHAANENKKMKPDPSLSKKSASEKPTKARKALKRL